MRVRERVCVRVSVRERVRVRMRVPGRARALARVFACACVHLNGSKMMCCSAGAILVTSKIACLTSATVMPAPTLN